MKQRRRSAEIEDYIIDNVSNHPKDIGRITAAQFGISRMAVSKHLRALIQRELLVASGNTKARQYTLKTIAEEAFRLKVAPDLQEDVVWRQRIVPLLKDVQANVVEICQYGFTEMLNNVVDHSESDSAGVVVTRNAASINIFVIDEGVGVFNKIQREFNLDDPRHALLELSKGKLTSDREHHTGEGIFFTSRMFDKFVLESGTLSFCRFNKEDGWLIETEDRELIQGTRVSMVIHPRATQAVEEIFGKYSTELHDFGFTRTHVPLQLLRYEGEQLMSRSQAKRLLARVDQFKEVFLDFKGITTIGQAFADEIFRVYRKQHPNVHIIWVNTNTNIENMIMRAREFSENTKEN